MTTRRQTMKVFGLAAAAHALSISLPPLSGATVAAPDEGPYSLPVLPYAYGALEPHIDAKTMNIHHDLHHAGYVRNLNSALSEHPELGKKPVEDLLRDIASLPESIREAVRNNGGGHASHTLYWQCMSGEGGGRAPGAIRTAISDRFGSFSTFQGQLTRAATGVVGSGWGWLSLRPNKELVVEATSNQDTPWSSGNTPLLCVDVWEHAYYLKHQNRRAEYVDAWWNVVNWEFVGKRFEELMEG